MKDLYTLTETAKMLNHSVLDLRNWINRGILVPTRKAPKRGSSAMFSMNCICYTAVFLNLVKMGVDGKKAEELSHGITLATDLEDGSEQNLYTATVKNGEVLLKVEVNLKNLMKGVKQCD